MPTEATAPKPLATQAKRLPQSLWPHNGSDALPLAVLAKTYPKNVLPGYSGCGQVRPVLFSMSKPKHSGSPKKRARIDLPPVLATRSREDKGCANGEDKGCANVCLLDVCLSKIRDVLMAIKNTDRAMTCENVRHMFGRFPSDSIDFTEF